MCSSDLEDRDDPLAIGRRTISKGIEVYEINGPFFFGMVSTFIETMNNIEHKPSVRILRMRHVLSIDATALNAIRQAVRRSRMNGIDLVISGIHAQPLVAVQKAGIYDELGEENFCHNIDAALLRAEQILAQKST